MNLSPLLQKVSKGFFIKILILVLSYNAMKWSANTFSNLTRGALPSLLLVSAKCHLILLSMPLFHHQKYG